MSDGPARKDKPRRWVAPLILTLSVIVIVLGAMLAVSIMERR